MVLLGHKGSYEKSNFSGWFVEWGIFYDAMIRYCNHFYPPMYACSHQGRLATIHFHTKAPIENISKSVNQNTTKNLLSNIFLLRINQVITKNIVLPDDNCQM